VFFENFFYTPEALAFFDRVRQVSKQPPWLLTLPDGVCTNNVKCIRLVAMEQVEHANWWNELRSSLKMSATNKNALKIRYHFSQLMQLTLYV
jgi:hypothetical protein